MQNSAQVLNLRQHNRSSKFVPNLRQQRGSDGKWLGEWMYKPATRAELLGSYYLINWQLILTTSNKLVKLDNYILLVFPNRSFDKTKQFSLFWIFHRNTLCNQYEKFWQKIKNLLLWILKGVHSLLYKLTTAPRLRAAIVCQDQAQVLKGHKIIPSH
jgi:hypothetical protein